MKEIFDPYVLGPFDRWPMGTPLPHADVLNEWSPTLVLNDQRNLQGLTSLREPWPWHTLYVYYSTIAHLFNSESLYPQGHRGHLTIQKPGPLAEKSSLPDRPIWPCLTRTWIIWWWCSYTMPSLRYTYISICFRSKLTFFDQTQTKLRFYLKLKVRQFRILLLVFANWPKKNRFLP